MAKRDYYEVLGVKRDASDAQIKTPESAAAPTAPAETPPAPTADPENKSNENELDHQNQMDRKPAVTMSSREARAKRMYIQAMGLCKKADAEKDAAGKQYNQY